MFYITYFAKKHGKFITRKGQLDKPDGTPSQKGAYIDKSGQSVLNYWDLDAEPNENGNQWRCAKNPMTWKERE